MARYIDADALLAELNEELMYESTLHTEEHENYLKKGIRIAINDVKRFPTADVAPKSEVEELKAIIADHKANEEQWQELYADTVDKWEKAYEELEIKLENAKAEVVREIFEEILASIATHAFTSKSEDYANGAYDTIEWVDSKIGEVEKKYTEETS